MRLLELTAGAVYHDGLGALTAIRDQLAYYPPDVWRYLLAAQWRRIAQPEAFVGRTGEVGDEVGSRLVAATLVRDLMRLSFLQERRYAPDSKWFGTAFAGLEAGAERTPVFHGVLSATTWPDREAQICAAYEVVARRHNALDITPSLDAQVSRFQDRPVRVIHGDRFAEAITDAITDPAVTGIVARAGVIGSIDQITDNVDVVSDPRTYRTLRALYEEPEPLGTRSARSPGAHA